MSKIGKLPVIIKQGVSVTIDGQNVSVTGAKGTAVYRIPDVIQALITDGKVIVSQREGKKEETKALFGLVRATVANMITGVSDGFEKKLVLSGVGYRAQMSGNDLTLSLGFSHPVKIQAPAGIQFAVIDNVVSIIGTDIGLVGNTAATIRAIKPPEPYKGKGITYAGEKIRRKAGKAAKAVGAAGAK